jgi:hypothetical protein
LNKRGFMREKLMNRKRYLVIVGIAAVAALIAILLYAMPANHQPAITGLKTEPEIVLPRGSCIIVCTATDLDGDELSYNWSDTGGAIIGKGAEVVWTAPDSVVSYNVAVTVTDGRGGKATDYVTVTVRTNKPPKITNLMASADWTTPSSSVNVMCNATDPDGDELSYTWSASGGNITGTGPEVIWSAPKKVGIYDVTVLVTDVLDWSDTRSISLTAGPPPVIENLVVTAKVPKYLKTPPAGTVDYDYDVWKTQEYYIKCVASGTGELVYDWSCNAGEISGEGSNITWTAPNESPVKATVTVIVSDAAGNRVGKNIVFHVPPSGCG